MLDSAGVPPDLSLFVQAGDDVVFVCCSIHAGHGWRGKGGLIYVVVHRSHGNWTHVYRVVQDARPGRLAVFVEKVIEGDHAREAGDWARASFSAAPTSSSGIAGDPGLAVLHRNAAAQAQPLGPQQVA